MPPKRKKATKKRKEATIATEQAPCRSARQRRAPVQFVPGVNPGPAPDNNPPNGQQQQPQQPPPDLVPQPQQPQQPPPGPAPQPVPQQPDNQQPDQIDLDLNGLNPPAGIQDQEPNQLLENNNEDVGNAADAARIAAFRDNLPNDLILQMMEGNIPQRNPIQSEFVSTIKF
ncbi:hypothetical protein M422DRAFT_24927, partial [Sphaerobolus stellatus SS14]